MRIGGQSTSPSQPGEYRRTNLADPTPTLRCSANLQPGERDRYAEGGGEVKRDQAEPKENSNHEKWKKREGIKRRLQDEPTQPTTPPSFSTMPVYQPENMIHMHKEAGGVKRGQTELEKNLHHDKWRKQEGIKRGLRDIPRVPYEEYEASWDQEIQAKKCKGLINCILDRYGCMERSTKNLVSTVRIPPLIPAM